MSWRDRDYSRETWTGRSPAPFGLRWPTRGAAVLIGLHVAAFALLYLIASERGGTGIVRRLALSDASAYPLGILVHPLASPDLLTLITNVAVVWWLGGHVEQRLGGRRMAGLYVAGSLVGGAAFFVLARTVPALASVALDYPAGGFAAWGVAACRGLSGETTVLFGRVRSVAPLIGIGAAIAIGLMFAFRGPGAPGWLAALIAGGLAAPAVQLLPGAPTRRQRPPRPVVTPSVPFEVPPPAESLDEPDIDDVLAKISRSGLTSLSPAERERLEAARQAKLRRATDLRG